MHNEELLRYHVVLGKFLSIQLTSPIDLGTLQGTKRGHVTLVGRDESELESS